MARPVRAAPWRSRALGGGPDSVGRGPGSAGGGEATSARLASAGQLVAVAVDRFDEAVGDQGVEAALAAHVVVADPLERGAGDGAAVLAQQVQQPPAQLSVGALPR